MATACVWRGGEQSEQVERLNTHPGGEEKEGREQNKEKASKEHQDGQSDKRIHEACEQRVWDEGGVVKAGCRNYNLCGDGHLTLFHRENGSKAGHDLKPNQRPHFCKVIQGTG